MAKVIEGTEADRASKAKHRAVWAQGDYPSVAAEFIPELGRELVEAAGVGPGDRGLDVAGGTGSAAIPAALAWPDPPAATTGEPGRATWSWTGSTCCTPRTAR